MVYEYARCVLAKFLAPSPIDRLQARCLCDILRRLFLTNARRVCMNVLCCPLDLCRIVLAGLSLQSSHQFLMPFTNSIYFNISHRIANCILLLTSRCLNWVSSGSLVPDRRNTLGPTKELARLRALAKVKQSKLGDQSN